MSQSEEVGGYHGYRISTALLGSSHSRVWNPVWICFAGVTLLMSQWLVLSGVMRCCILQCRKHSTSTTWSTLGPACLSGWLRALDDWLVYTWLHSQNSISECCSTELHLCTLIFCYFFSVYLCPCCTWCAQLWTWAVFGVDPALTYSRVCVQCVLDICACVSMWWSSVSLSFSPCSWQCSLLSLCLESQWDPETWYSIDYKVTNH